MIQAEKRTFSISVRDEGVGLPADFNPATSKRLETRLVTLLSKQLNARQTRPFDPKGAHFELLVPVKLTTAD